MIAVHKSKVEWKFLPFCCRLHPEYVIRGGELELGRPLVDALQTLPHTGHGDAAISGSIPRKFAVPRRDLWLRSLLLKLY